MSVRAQVSKSTTFPRFYKPPSTVHYPPRMMMLLASLLSVWPYRNVSPFSPSKPFFSGSARLVFSIRYIHQFVGSLSLSLSFILGLFVNFLAANCYVDVKFPGGQCRTFWTRNRLVYDYGEPQVERFVNVSHRETQQCSQNKLFSYSSTFFFNDPAIFAVKRYRNGQSDARCRHVAPPGDGR